MAVVTQLVCPECGISWRGPTSQGRFRVDCIDCLRKKKEKADQDKQKHLDDLSKLSLDERLGRIEEWIYTQEKSKPRGGYFPPDVFG